MKVRHPPGRAGRPWLAHRLAVARRGAELLAEKQRALLRERARLEPLLAQARSDWEQRAREAEPWLARAAMLGGERQLDFVPSALAEVTVGWRTILGVRCPADPRVELPPERELVPTSARSQRSSSASTRSNARTAPACAESQAPTRQRSRGQTIDPGPARADEQWRRQREHRYERSACRGAADARRSSWAL